MPYQPINPAREAGDALGGYEYVKNIFYAILAFSGGYSEYPIGTTNISIQTFFGSILPSLIIDINAARQTLGFDPINRDLTNEDQRNLAIKEARLFLNWIIEGYHQPAPSAVPTPDEIQYEIEKQEAAVQQAYRTGEKIAESVNDFIKDREKAAAAEAEAARKAAEERLKKQQEVTTQQARQTLNNTLNELQRSGKISEEERALAAKALEQEETARMIGTHLITCPTSSPEDIQEFITDITLAHLETQRVPSAVASAIATKTAAEVTGEREAVFAKVITEPSARNPYQIAAELATEAANTTSQDLGINKKAQDNLRESGSFEKIPKNIVSTVSTTAGPVSQQQVSQLISQTSATIQRDSKGFISAAESDIIARGIISETLIPATIAVRVAEAQRVGGLAFLQDPSESSPQAASTADSIVQAQKQLPYGQIRRMVVETVNNNREGIAAVAEAQGLDPRRAVDSFEEGLTFSLLPRSKEDLNIKEIAELNLGKENLSRLLHDGVITQEQYNHLYVIQNASDTFIGPTQKSAVTVVTGFGLDRQRKFTITSRQPDQKPSSKAHTHTYIPQYGFVPSSTMPATKAPKAPSPPTPSGAPRPAPSISIVTPSGNQFPIIRSQAVTDLTHAYQSVQSSLHSLSGQALFRLQNSPVGQAFTSFTSAAQSHIISPLITRIAASPPVAWIRNALAQNVIKKVAAEGAKRLAVKAGVKATVKGALAKIGGAIAGTFVPVIGWITSAALAISTFFDLAKLARSFFDWLKDNPWILAPVFLGGLLIGGPIGLAMAGLAGLSILGLALAGGLGAVATVFSPVGWFIGTTFAFLAFNTAVAIGIAVAGFVGTWIFLTIFYQIFLLPQGFMSNVPSTQMSSIATETPSYFSVQKTASPNQFPYEDLKVLPESEDARIITQPKTITYTVTVTPKDSTFTLENLSISDTMTLLDKDNNSYTLEPKNAASTPITLVNGKYTYEIIIDINFISQHALLDSNNKPQPEILNNSAIINTVTIAANVKNSKTNQTIQNVTQSASATVIIGKHDFIDPRGWPVWGSDACVTRGPMAPGGTHASAQAVDIGGSAGRTVVATHIGTVKSITYRSDIGSTITIDGPNSAYSTVYIHMSRNLQVKVGDSVNADTPLGTIATDIIPNIYWSGPHLHYELKRSPSKGPDINSYLTSPPDLPIPHQNTIQASCNGTKYYPVTVSGR
jgi:murein DD-endopeptidase MepM/ murein hydrolase activator NlpD/ElaB/YqjD/DUF883 family membrane-anchored ribosome-binding protein